MVTGACGQSHCEGRQEAENLDQNQRWVITFKACPRDPASLHVSEISQPLNIVPQTGDHMFKHMSLWGTFHIQIIIDVPWALSVQSTHAMACTEQVVSSCPIGRWLTRDSHIRNTSGLQEFDSWELCQGQVSFASGLRKFSTSSEGMPRCHEVTTHHSSSLTGLY